MSVFGNRRVGFQTDPSKTACKHRRHCSSNSPMASRSWVDGRRKVCSRTDSASRSSFSITTQYGPDQ